MAENEGAMIDVDIGGTFTDAFVVHGNQIAAGKSPTTPYNLSVGFLGAIEEAAEKLGLEMEDLLESTERIRYSTTIAMNTLIQRTGPKLALLTTEGFEDTILIGRGSAWKDGLTVSEARRVASLDKPIPIIPREMTVGVKERIDWSGRILRPLDEEDVLEKVRYLVDKGARGFVISLLVGYLNPKHEKRVKEIIETEYPEIYLGHMPVLCSHEILPKKHEYSRTITTVLDTYLHGSMQEQLRGMGDELRDRGYRKPLHMVHNTGGIEEVFKTRAIDTFNGGPVAGLIGSAYLAKTLYGYPHVVMTDMGGTSFDLGLVVEGSTRSYAFNPVIEQWLVNLTILETKSIGAGGGSIAWVNRLLFDRVEVGPQSAGSIPGPASYDLGGTEPTVTDADIVLGYINPDYFHGGKHKLNREKALDSVERVIARPRNIKVEEGAWLIRNIIDAKMGGQIYKETVLRGYDPREYMMFVAGGAGPVHCCNYGAFAGIKSILVFPYSPVFCAFGSSTMDLLHIYEQSQLIHLLQPGGRVRLTDFEVFNNTVRQLVKIASADLRSEGIEEKEINFALEMDMKYGGQLDIKRTLSPLLFINSAEDVRAVLDAFAKEYAEAYSPVGVYPEGGVDIENFILKASVFQGKVSFSKSEKKGADPRKAQKSERKAYFEKTAGFTTTPVYVESLVEPGNVIEGPAIIESDLTSCVVPPGFRYINDEYLNAIIEEVK